MGTTRWINIYAREFPIPIIDFKQQQLFSNFVDKILELKKQNKDTTSLENQIDILVYKLYELTYDEVKIVDPELKFTKKEYQLFQIK